jgi:hypothetical protein
VEWEDRSDNESGFHVERSPDSGATWTRVGAVSANVTSFTDTGLVPDAVYYYRIISFNPAHP